MIVPAAAIAMDPNKSEEVDKAKPKNKDDRSQKLAIVQMVDCTTHFTTDKVITCPL